jgi:catechol 2,3-dioxygenase-like lactoylglutathione lyase family enzyme
VIADALVIDHISIAVRDLEATGRFYETVLGTLGYGKLRMQPGTLGFGKRYPECGSGPPRISQELHPGYGPATPLTTDRRRPPSVPCPVP